MIAIPKSKDRTTYFWGVMRDSQVKIENDKILIHPPHFSNSKWLVGWAAFVIMISFYLQIPFFSLFAVIGLVNFFHLKYRTPSVIEISSIKISWTYPSTPFGFWQKQRFEVSHQQVNLIYATRINVPVLIVQINTGQKFMLAMFESFWQLEKARKATKLTKFGDVVEEGLRKAVYFKFFRFP